MNYKDVCEEEIWFILSNKKKEGRRFLEWAKELGCVWLNGSEIEPKKGLDFPVVAINPNRKLGYVPAMAMAAKQFKGIKRVNFKNVYKALKKKKESSLRKNF